MKIGITGAAGNIGRVLCKGLADKYSLTLFDIHEIDTEETFVQMDLSSPDALAGAFEGLDALIHLAGDPRPNAPKAVTILNNFYVTSFVFEEAREAKLKKIVYASSNFMHEGMIEEYLKGHHKGLITLDSSPTPKTLYGKSKLFGEEAGRHFSHLGIKFVALRIGWSVPEDNPKFYDSPYMRAMFCSHRDLVGFFDKALQAEQDYLVAFAISNNDERIFDLKETEKQLGFSPQDNSANY